MACTLSIKGKQLIIFCPRPHVKYVSLVYIDSRVSSISTKSVRGCALVEGRRRFSRHISVVYISVRLIISATWVRQMPLVFDIEANSSVDSKARPESITTDESFLHENMFVFDKAFAQEIRYLFAELDFDLYMCRNKQGEGKKHRGMHRRIPIWRQKAQHNTFVYFIRQNDRNNGIRCENQGKKFGDYLEEVQLNRVLGTFSDGLKGDGGEFSNSLKEDEITVEEYLKQCKDGDATVASSEYVSVEQHGKEDIAIEAYLRLCEEERASRDITVEEYLGLYEEEELSDDMTVEKYLRYYKEEGNQADMTVEEYLRMHEEKKVYKDISIEEYLAKCKENEVSEAITVEDYLRLCEEETATKDLTVEEYLNSCQEEKGKDGVNIEEYLRLMKGRISEDITVEDYLRLCEEENSSRELTVEEYLQSYEEERGQNNVTVEEYLRLAEEELSPGLTVEEYLKLCEEDKRSSELTVENYLKLCEEETERNGASVEDYLRLCEEKLSQEMTIEEYLKLCEEENMVVELTVEDYIRACEEERDRSGIDIEDYLRLAQKERYQDMTVEEFLMSHKNCQGSRDMTVEEYLRFIQEDTHSAGLSVEDYLKLCEEEKLRDVTVEEYLRLHEERETKDISVEEYLKLCEEEEEQHKGEMTVEEYLSQNDRSVRDLTVEEYLEVCAAEEYSSSSSKEFTVEEYLRLCEQGRQEEDTTVEEYLRRCKEQKYAKDLTIEEYLRQCELEGVGELFIEEYILQFKNEQDSRKISKEEGELWDDFKHSLFDNFMHETRQVHNVSEEVLCNDTMTRKLKGDVMSSDETDHFKPIESIFLPKIFSHYDQDNELGIAAMKAQPRHDLEIEGEEEAIVESFVPHVESSGNNWMLFESFDIEEELLSEAPINDSNENGMESALKRHGLMYSAELWLLFPFYRRTPWIHISVLYRDNIRFDWGISHVVETEAGATVQDSESVNACGVCEEEPEEYTSMGISKHGVVEEEVLVMTRLASDFAEIEFSFLDFIENEENNNNNVHSEVFCNGHEKNTGKQRPPAPKPKKKPAPALKQPRYHASDEQLNKTKNIHFAPITNLSKKGLIYKSKETIFTGIDPDSKSAWNNLEKIHCKHAKTITFPETLRRTVSKNSLDILESPNEDDTSMQVRQDNENEAPNELIISPLKINIFGKNLRESNV